MKLPLNIDRGNSLDNIVRTDRNPIKVLSSQLTPTPDIQPHLKIEMQIPDICIAPFPSRVKTQPWSGVSECML